MSNLIKHIEAVPHHAVGSAFTVAVPPHSSIHLQDAHKRDLLILSGDEFEGRHQILVFAAGQDDVMLHIRLKDGQFHHVRPGDGDPHIVQSHQADPEDWMNPPAGKPDTGRFVVAAANTDGEPDLYFCRLVVTPKDRESGRAYAWAKMAAAAEGYEPDLAYDCDKGAAGKSLAQLFVWESAATYMFDPLTRTLKEVDHG